MNKNKIILAILVFSLLIASGCKKDYLTTKPTDSIPAEDLSSELLVSLLNGQHNLFNSRMAGILTNHAQWGNKALDLSEDIMASDIIVTSSNFEWFVYHYQMVSTSASTYWMPYNIWTYCYRIINNSNIIIEAVDINEDPAISQEVLDNLKGQALAYRAWAYHKLIISFSHNIKFIEANPQFNRGVPLYVKSISDEATHIGRGTATEIYDQINDDISLAIELLESSGNAVGEGKANITANVAHGLASRFALVQEEWQDAIEHAAAARSGYPLMGEDELKSGLGSRNIGEFMWCSTQTTDEYNQKGILCFISWMDHECPGYSNAGAFRMITSDLYSKIDDTDIRKNWWLANPGSGLPTRIQNKFKVVDQSGFDFDNVYMRAAEMYLNEAEAQFQNGNEAAAKDLLTELVITRNPNYDISTLSGDNLLNEIYIQRRIELWAEGFGFQDVRRRQHDLEKLTTSGNHNRALANGADRYDIASDRLFIPANDPKLLFKIPQNEIDNNNAMTGADQNP